MDEGEVKRLKLSSSSSDVGGKCENSHFSKLSEEEQQKIGDELIETLHESKNPENKSMLQSDVPSTENNSENNTSVNHVSDNISNIDGTEKTVSKSSLKIESTKEFINKKPNVLNHTSSSHTDSNVKVSKPSKNSVHGLNENDIINKKDISPLKKSSSSSGDDFIIVNNPEHKNSDIDGSVPSTSKKTQFLGKKLIDSRTNIENSLIKSNSKASEIILIEDNCVETDAIKLSTIQIDADDSRNDRSEVFVNASTDLTNYNDNDCQLIVSSDSDIEEINDDFDIDDFIKTKKLTRENFNTFFQLFSKHKITFQVRKYFLFLLLFVCNINIYMYIM